MNVDKLIIINSFGQDLLSLNQLITDLQLCDIESKRRFLNEFSFLILQSKPQNKEIEEAIRLGNLKATFTPYIKLKKGVTNQSLKEVIELPDSELNKTLILLLSLFKVTYKRVREKDKDNPYKWWFQDLSNQDFIKRIKSLSEIKVLIQKLYNKNGSETGAVVSAILPFPITIFEKDIIERQLELYAFNTLYEGHGLNLYREINTDTASLTIIKDINGLEQKESMIGIY